MAGESVSTRARVQFSDTVHVELNQNESLLRPLARMVKVDAEDYFYDGLGSIDPTKLEERHQKIVFGNIEHKRRLMNTDAFGMALGIDDKDIENGLNDPKNDYARQMARGMAREMDRVLYTACGASIGTGKKGTTVISAATDGVTTVAMTGGITVAKILEVTEGLIDHAVPEPWYWTISGGENTAMLQLSQLTSGDYTRQFALEKGRLQVAFGLGIILFPASVDNPILDVTGGVRTGYVIGPEALLLGVSREMGVEVEKRTDLYTTHQVVMTSRIGAIRTEGERIIATTFTA